MDLISKALSRRRLMQGTAAAVLASISAFAQDRKATITSAGFETAADVTKAEQEGAVLFYTHDSDPAGAAITEAFSKDFPKIRASYTRLQNGALYSKILTERSAGRFLADAIQFSDISTAYDFKKRAGYEQYASPQYQFFPSEYLSDPAGYFFFSGVTFVGIAYNTNLTSAADAPKNWKDLLDPRWKNAISMKQATSGTQFVQWVRIPENGTAMISGLSSPSRSRRDFICARRSSTASPRATTRSAGLPSGRAIFS